MPAGPLPQLLPTSLTRLSLPGVSVLSREGLEALGRLRRLAVLEVAGLAAGAGEFLPALQVRVLRRLGGRAGHGMWESASKPATVQPVGCCVLSPAQEHPRHEPDRQYAFAIPACGRHARLACLPACLAFSLPAGAAAQ